MIIIKSKHDAENLINSLSSDWTYTQILHDLSEITGDQYHTNKCGVGYYINHEPVGYDQIVNILYRHRKAFNEIQRNFMRDYRQFLRSLAHT